MKKIMKFTPNSKIQSIPFVKPLSETSFPRFSGRGEQVCISPLITDLVDRGPSTILESCNTYCRGVAGGSRQVSLNYYPIREQVPFCSELLSIALFKSIKLQLIRKLDLVNIF